MSKKTQNAIKWMCNDIRDLLIEKNKAYGNSAIDPENIFSKLDNAQAICARIDDKLARIKNRGLDDKTEDTLDDLIGYLVLLKVARSEEAANVTVWTMCNCALGCTMCSKSCDCVCNMEPNTSDKFSDYSEGYAPPWSQEIEKVTVFVSDPGDEMKPIEKKA
mgnify:FL=1|jgi:hypothetical protein|tara:strand:+ start:1229 stop:1714 length:486 start_codon:yes stop_codon:yes gene_type:complete